MALVDSYPNVPRKVAIDSLLQYIDEFNPHHLAVLNFVVCH